MVALTEVITGEGIDAARVVAASSCPSLSDIAAVGWEAKPMHGAHSMNGAPGIASTEAASIAVVKDEILLTSTPAATIFFARPGWAIRGYAYIAFYAWIVLFTREIGAHP